MIWCRFELDGKISFGVVEDGTRDRGVGRPAG